MFDFLKTFGQGLLYLVLSPFILLMVVLYTIYSFFVFFFIIVIVIIAISIIILVLACILALVSSLLTLWLADEEIVLVSIIISAVLIMLRKRERECEEKYDKRGNHWQKMDVRSANDLIKLWEDRHALRIINVRERASVSGNVECL